MTDKVHDVAVIGAGPGGSATAHYLAQRGLDVLLLDKAEFPRDKTCGDGLTPRALGVLEDMGILAEAERLGFRVNGLELHASDGNVMTSPIPDMSPFPNYLLIVPRLKLDDLIRQRAVASGAQFQGPVRVRGIEAEGEGVEIRAEYNGGTTYYRARVAVLAIGANMRMLLQMGVLKRQPSLILAARAYYEGMSGLNENVQAHFEGVPLPGYGWVFPISETAANVGVGFWKPFYPWQKPPASARAALDDFLLTRKMTAMLNGAQALGPVKSYPLRIDFANAPTFAERLLLVGETAGLVSPLTGEGIDFALESGKLAAESLAERFEKGDFSLHALSGYDVLLRRHFQRLFVFLGRIRRLYVNPLLMSRAISVAERDAELKRLLVSVMMSQTDAADMVNLRTFRKVLFGR